MRCVTTPSSMSGRVNWMSQGEERGEREGEDFLSSLQARFTCFLRQAVDGARSFRQQLLAPTVPVWAQCDQAWAAKWALLAAQGCEERISNRMKEQTVDAPRAPRRGRDFRRD